MDKQLPTFSEVQLITVLTALARMGFDPPEAFAARLCKHVESLGTSPAALVSAMALLGLKAPPPRAPA